MDDDELFTMQMVNLTTMLFDALAGAGGDPMIAAQSPQLLQAWWTRRGGRWRSVWPRSQSPASSSVRPIARASVIPAWSSVTAER